MVKDRRSLDDVQIQNPFCPCLCRMWTLAGLKKLMWCFQRTSCSYTSSMWSGWEASLNHCPKPSGATGVKSTTGRLKWARYPTQTPRQVTHACPTPLTLSCVWEKNIHVLWDCNTHQTLFSLQVSLRFWGWIGLRLSLDSRWQESHWLP